jgi:hypothetical protein
MGLIKRCALFIAITLFFLGCNSSQPSQQIATNDPQLDDALIETEGDEYWARDNFDLQRVGDLVHRADSPEQFEALLNEEGGINNLDLNGDGYVDYISVDEFEDRDSNARGLSLFSRFGPDLIQEIATILFYRDDLNSPGARVLLTGNEQLYGDNYFYETNSLDRSVGLVTNLFDDRDSLYRSPYHYDNYPTNYEVFEIVDPPVYRTRVAELIPQPAFIQTTAVPVYVGKVKIKSPHKGKWMDKIHAKLAKPTREQAEFIAADPGRIRFVDDRGGRRNDFRGDDDPGRGDDRGRGRDDRGVDDRGRGGDDRGRGKDDRGGRADDKGGKGGGNDKGKGGGKKP